MAPGKRAGRRAVSLAVLTGFLLVHAVAPAKAADDLRARHRFDIPAQALDTALFAFSDQAKIQVLMWAVPQSRIQSRGAVGELSAEAALTTILSDTGFAFKVVDAETVAIVTPTAGERQSKAGSPAPGAAPASTLATIAPDETAAARESPRDTHLEEVVVTGSSIRGISPIGSALNQVSRANIVASGATTTTELLRSLPQLASFNATGVNGGQDQASFVDQPAIHGIGVGNGGGGLTLVLVDGRRLPGAGINQTAPDPGAIPPSAIERVEIVADGASSIYGSDAVAGVINFVLRKNFNGAETQAKAGYGADYRTYHFSQLAGKTWDRGSALAVYEYSGNTAVNGSDRRYYGDNQVARGAGDNRGTICSPANVEVNGVDYALSASGAREGAVILCENNRDSDLYPNQHRNQGLLSLRQDLTENIEAFANTLYSERTVRNREAASAASNSLGGLAVTVSGGPFYDFVTSLGVPASVHSVTYNPGGSFRNRIAARTSSSAAGLNIAFANDWVAQLSGNYGAERDVISQYGINQQLAIAAAAAGTFNPYGVGPETSRALLNAIGDYESRYNGKQTVEEGLIKLDGTLLGSVKAAVGVTARKEQFIAVFREGPLAGPDAAPSTRSVGKRNVRSAFAEVYVPLIAPSLELSLSGRYDDYDDVGDTTNPKIGLNWAPLKELLLRASFGRSFHAPSLADAPTAIDTRAIRFGDATGSADPAAYSIVLAGGNTLKPETADTYSAGFNWAPPALTGVTFDASYWHVKYQDVITFPSFAPVNEPGNALFDAYRVYNPTAAQIAEATAGFRHDGLLYPDVSTLPTAIYDLRRQNFAQQIIDGIDFFATYRFATSRGDFEIGAAGTRLFTFDQRITGDATVVNRLDTNAAVKMRARGTLGWHQGAVSAAVFMNYTDGYVNTTNQAQVGAFTTFDLHASWPLRRIELTLDGANLFDADPPFYYDPTSNSNQRGYDATAASALGRVVALGFRKIF